MAPISVLRFASSRQIIYIDNAGHALVPTRIPFIYIERVSIYGHSGDGFMSAAALLQKPYNEFFKAAVATAGNHDNNVYNYTWSERYHGLKEVVIKKEDSKSKDGDKTAQ